MAHDSKRLETTAGIPTAAPPQNGQPNGDSRGLIVAAPPVQPAAAATSASPEASSFDIKVLLAAFRRRWFLAVSLGLVLGGIAGTAVWFAIPAPYTAFAELHISSVPETIIFDTVEPNQDFTTYKQTHMRMVKGPFVLAAALRDKEAAATSLIRSQPHAPDWLEQTLIVKEDGLEFFSIRLSGEDPQELAAIVTAVTNAYIEEVVNEDQNNRRRRLAKLEKVHRDHEEKLSIKRSALRRLAEALHTSDASAMSQLHLSLIEYHSQLRQEYTRIQFEIRQATVQLQAREKASEGVEPEPIPDAVVELHITRHPEFLDASNRIASQEATVSGLKERLKDGHAKIQAAEKLLTELKNSLEIVKANLAPTVREQIAETLTKRSSATDAELTERIRLLTLQKDELELELEQQKIEEKQAGIKSFELESIRAEIEQFESIAQQISQEINHLEVELQSKPRISLYRKAEAPRTRDTGKKHKLSAIAGLGLFGLVVGGIVFVEHHSRRISGLDEVADGLNMRVMGALPLMPRYVTSAKSGKKYNGRKSFWNSVLTESIDSTRTVLLKDAAIEQMKVVMVASSMGGEGKTTLSCHLATSMARTGRKIILVDCDLRRPSVQRVFDMPAGPGLCEVLRGEVSLDEAIQEGSISGLSILTAGKINQQVLQLLSRDGLKPIFDELREKYDFVVVDSSPVLPVTDALLVAQHVDGVIISIRRDVSRMVKVAATCQRMEMLGVSMLGAVVIGLDDGSYGYRYPYKYGYGYGYGYNRYGYSPYGYSTQPPA